MQSAKVIKEKLTNEIIELKHTNSLAKMESDILGDRLKTLYDAIKTLGDAKEVEDIFTQRIEKVEDDLREVVGNREDLRTELSTILQERDRLRTELKEMTSCRNKVHDEKERFVTALRDAKNVLEKDFKESEEKCLKLKDEYLKLEKAYKTVSLEREKMRQRLVKMKRRRNVDINQKICKVHLFHQSLNILKCSLELSEGVRRERKLPLVLSNASLRVRRRNVVVLRKDE